MMDSRYGTSPYGVNAMGYATVESLLDDVSRKMASSNLTRKYSRGSTGQRSTGPMRVVKPKSANNSPRNSMSLARRRTVNAESPYHKRVMMGEQHPGANLLPSNDGQQMPHSNRPMSWHPTMSSQHIPHHVSPQRYDARNMFPGYELPRTTSDYSGYTSPASAFSPGCVPYTGYDNSQQLIYPNAAAAFYPVAQSEIYFQTPAAEAPQLEQHYTSVSDNMDNSMYSHFDWSNFTANGFETSTSPPTPETFLPIQHPDPVFPSEDSISYHPLSDSEGDGEELIGMGLYDAPDVAKSPATENHFDQYRALMMAQLLGPNYKKIEPTGKGLKLEDAWNPPATEDEDDDAADEDGEGEDDDDEVTGTEQKEIVSRGTAPQSIADTAESCQPNSSTRQMNYTQGFGRNGWF